MFVCRTVKMRNPGPIIPLIPLTFVLAYQYDMTKGNKMERIIGECMSTIIALVLVWRESVRHHG